jgi:hypothetical protein
MLAVASVDFSGMKKLLGEWLVLQDYPLSEELN